MSEHNQPAGERLKSLVTGAAGFVGGYLMAALREKGYEVTGSRLEENDPELIHLDVTDKSNIVKVLKSVKPDVIFHLAGFSSVKQSFAHPDLCMQINYGGTRNLLESVKEVVPEAKVLVIGSAEVYGNPEFLPITEEHPLNGKNPYALSRIKQESLKNDFPELNLYWTRSFNHTGPGQGLGFVVPDFAQQIADIVVNKKKKIVNVGNLSAERDISDVRDVVQAYIAILEKGSVHEIYNVCSGKPIKIEKVLAELIKLSGTEIEIIVEKAKLREIDVPAYYGSFYKLMKQTEWKPRIHITKTLMDTFEYWLKLEQ